MGRTGITFHDVSNAIATLQGNQKNPTVDSIREELGTGSKSTIAKLLKEWKSKNGIHNNDETGIPTELLSLIRGLWEKLQSDADETVKMHQIDSDAQIHEIKTTLLKTQEQNALLHHDIKTVQEKLDQQTSVTADLKNQLQESQNEKIKLDTAIQSLLNQNENHKSENDKLHQLLKNTQDNLTHYQHAIEKQRSDMQLQIEKERADFALKIASLQNQFNQVLKDNAVLESKLQTSIAHSENQQITIDRQTEEKSSLINQNTTLSSENNFLQDTKKQHEKTIAEINNTLREKEKEIKDISIDNAIVKNNYENTKNKLTHHENKIKILEGEINNLLNENKILMRKNQKTEIT